MTNEYQIRVVPERVSMESIKRGASVPRNKLLFNYGINLLPYTGAGSGITRALKFTPDIKFVNDEMLNEFVVTVERRNAGETGVKNDRVDDRDSDRDDRDKHLDDSGLVESGEKQGDRGDRDNELGTTHMAYKALNGTQKNIIQFCSIPRSAREILEHIGYSYHPTNINKFIKPLLEYSFIEMTEPEKPNSKNQKYRKVRKE